MGTHQQNLLCIPSGCGDYFDQYGAPRLHGAVNIRSTDQPWVEPLISKPKLCVRTRHKDKVYRKKPNPCRAALTIPQVPTSDVMAEKTPAFLGSWCKFIASTAIVFASPALQPRQGVVIHCMIQARNHKPQSTPCSGRPAAGDL